MHPEEGVYEFGSYTLRLSYFGANEADLLLWSSLRTFCMTFGTDFCVLPDGVKTLSHGHYLVSFIGILPPVRVTKNARSTTRAAEIIFIITDQNEQDGA